MELEELFGDDAVMLDGSMGKVTFALAIVLAVVAAFAFPLFWVMVIVPLIGRHFGVPYKVGSLPFDKDLQQQLSGWQSFWLAGVLAMGVGIFLLAAEVQIFIDRSHPSASRLMFEFFSMLVLGGLWNQVHNRW